MTKIEIKFEFEVKLKNLNKINTRFFLNKPLIGNMNASIVLMILNLGSHTNVVGTLSMYQIK